MNIILIGYGKMGQAIEKIARLDSNNTLHIFSKRNIEELKTIIPSSIDLAIEFTSPQSAYTNIHKCLELGIPVISGTTGWLDKKNEIDMFCNEKNGTFFYAPNFSIGMNLLFATNKHMASLINSRPEFSVSIEETHHTEKKDIPSGTAITLATDIINSIDRMNAWQQHPVQDPTTLPIKSIRMLDLPGIHKIKYESSMEIIELSHTTISRDAFAYGVLEVAKWINGKKGVLRMENFLAS